jgi:hypothetical protein
MNPFDLGLSAVSIRYLLAERVVTFAARVLEGPVKFPTIGKSNREQGIRQLTRQN